LWSGERCNALSKDLSILLGNFRATTASAADARHQRFSQALIGRRVERANDTTTPARAFSPHAAVRKK
jgi:hypothetical protein